MQEIDDAPPRDIYDAAIDHIMSQQSVTSRKAAASFLWSSMPALFDGKEPLAVLFRYCTPNGFAVHDGRVCGCITQVKDSGMDAASAEITERIRGDDLIPSQIDHWDGSREALERIAYYQREMDRLWNRDPAAQSKGQQRR